MNCSSLHVRHAWFVALLVLALFPAASHAQSARADYPVLDGEVYATAISGDTLYLAGSFSIVGPPTGGGILLDAVRGNPVGAPLQVQGGGIFAVVADGAGGYFLGGAFKSIRMQPRAGLAHLLPDGTLDPWVAGVSGSITALARSGNVLYAADGGRVLGIDCTTGALTGWQLNANASVRALAVSGTTVFLGGSFSLLGGLERSALAAASATTGQVLAWAPTLQEFDRNHAEVTPGSVSTLKVAQGKLYVGGNFYTVNGLHRRSAAALDPVTAQVLPWRPDADTENWDLYPYVESIDADDSVVYVGGLFSRVGAPTPTPRLGWAAFDPSSGVPTNLDLGLDNYYGASTAVAGGQVFVAGNFSQMLGQPRPSLGSVDPATGTLTEWGTTADLESGGLGWSGGIVVASGGTVFVAGDVHTFGSVRRSLAAIDLRSGQLLPWNPGADGAVLALAVSNGKVYAGGSFTTLGGVAHPWFGIIDAVSGVVAPLEPGFDGVVRALDVMGNTLYVGGDFGYVGNQPRSHLAALSTVDGSLGTFQPSANGSVLTLDHSSSLLYAGGSFTTIQGQSRSRLAAFNLTTGALQGWNPGANGPIHVVRFASPNLYAGGVFTVLGGDPKSNAGAVDATSGAITAWDPVTDGAVDALAIVPGRAYLGGAFTHVRGRARAGIAATDLGTSFVTSWDPSAIGGRVASLTAFGRTVIAGGAFVDVHSNLRAGLAGISDDAILDAPGADHRADGLVLARVTPDPVHGSATIRFSLAVAGHVRLTLHDVQGRTTGAPLVDATLAAGSHVIPLDARGLPAGLYWCRLECHGQQREQRMVVVR